MVRSPAVLRRGWLQLLLALALLLAQSAGLRHGVLHPHAGMGPGVAGLPLATADDAAHAAPGGVTHHEDGSALCRLVDHLGHADLLPVTPLAVLQAARPPLPLATLRAGATPSPTPAYEARGPPATALS